MTRKPVVRFVAAVAAGLAVGAALLAVIIVVNAGADFAGSTAATRYGWAIPIVTGLVVAAVAWALLSSESPDPEFENLRVASSACRQCGQPVLAEWRLCPYCGSLTAEDQPTVDPRRIAG